MSQKRQRKRDGKAKFYLSPHIFKNQRSLTGVNQRFKDTSQNITLKAFARCAEFLLTSFNPRIILVLPSNDLPWKEA